MALRREDGTGVARANTFGSVSGLLEYAADRGYDLSDQDEEVLEAGLVKAFDYLRDERQFNYRGVRYVTTNTAPWPRRGAVARRGVAIADNEIPLVVVEAQYAIVLRIIVEGIDLQPALERGGMVSSKTIGPISTSWFEGAPPSTVLPEVVGILEALLRKSTDLPEPYRAEPAAVPGFVTGQFDDPRAGVYDPTSLT